MQYLKAPTILNLILMLWLLSECWLTADWLLTYSWLISRRFEPERQRFTALDKLEPNKLTDRSAFFELLLEPKLKLEYQKHITTANTLYWLKFGPQRCPKLLRSVPYPRSRGLGLTLNFQGHGVVLHDLWGGYLNEKTILACFASARDLNFVNRAMKLANGEII